MIKKKILHVLNSRNYAGAQNVAITIISNLTDEYYMAYTSPHGSIKNVLKKREINYLPMDNFSISSLKRVIKEWKPEIIHAHDFTATIKCLMATFNIPIVSHIHQNPKWLHRINYRSISFFLCCLRISNIIPVSLSIFETSILSYVFKRKINIIENITDIELIRNKALDTELEYYDVAFIGRLVDVKDPIRFINIISEIVKKNSKIKAVIMGDGELKEKCEIEIKKRKLERNIYLKGFVSNPFPILYNSKVLVMTSKSEGLPMVVIEALSLGKPVLVPALVGIERLIDETCGVICKNNNEYVIELIKILENKDIYEFMSRNAKNKAEKMFDMKKYLEKFIEVYENVG